MKRLAALLLTLLLTTTVIPIHAQDGNLTSLVAGNTSFALDLYKLAIAADTDAGNLVFSPYSISQALALTYAGAKGDTAAQMAAVLHFALQDDELHRTFLALNGELLSNGNAEADPNFGTAEAILRIANALWGEKTYPFLASYIAKVKANYGAGLELVDFINNSEATRQQINDWVAEQTADRIQNILPEGVVDASTRLVLVNAVYFKNAWLFPFSSDATQDADFTLLDTSKVTVPMMTVQKNFGYLQQDNYQVVSLPYSGSKMSMLLILPTEGQIGGVEQKLTPELLASLSNDKLQFQLMNLHLPRFQFSYDLSLSSMLQQLGMTDAFDPAKADFSGMADVDPAQNLFLTAALHKAFIAVDENGTEAAAATAVMAGVTSAPAENPIEVRFDRPFLFAIRDDATGTILFMGRVMNPTTE
ncbi:MAG: serpin family protein [Anaerolineae bacterium]|nr:serpin family protein [Anaerolineae bacterium]